MKKVLIFSLGYYPEPVGGAEVAIKEITDRISPDEIEFHMVALGYDKKTPRIEKVGNVTVHRIGFSRDGITVPDLKKFPLHYNKHLFLFWAPIKALALNRKYHFDASWAMMAHPCGVPQAIFKILAPRVASVLTLQEGDPPEYMERLYKPVFPLFKRAFTKADVVQVISNFLSSWARKMGYVGNIVFIPNGASTEASKTFPIDELEAYKKEVGKNPGDILIVTVSRLVTKNAVDDIIRALSFLPENIKLLVVGGGEDEEKLKKMVAEMKLESRVYFTGHVDRTMTAKSRAISEIFCRPSRSEGFGNSFASAMVSRLPIIATQEGGIADFLFDKKRNPDKETTGWAVDKDSPIQIAEAVKDILTHSEQVKKVTDHAYQMVTTQYNWNFIAKDMKEKVFDVALAK
ncbi:MAG: glycosyltransferase [Candidatus Paceibacterota bacterium]|jgi:glycosyltransferase involved in cell wall biosynthesis